MIKQAFQRAFWVSFGVTVGGTLLPRLFNSWRYNSSYPPLALHVLMNFATGFVTCFLVMLLILFVKSKFKR